MATATALGLLALAGTGLAQTTMPRPSTIPAQTKPEPPPPAQTKNVDKPLSSDILNAAVYDSSESKIGSVDDLVLNKDGSPAQAIIGVSGFLGVGEKDVAVPFQDIKAMTRDGKNWLELDRTKDQLKAPPAYGTKAHKL